MDKEILKSKVIKAIDILIDDAIEKKDAEALLTLDFILKALTINDRL